ncbi:MAG: adenylate/guanylate cyclase domain-containing protein [Bacteroidales bacterium]|nr:adenylate/guanylate cyclase domain-containing protein [Bacteroidales bacterium]MBN2698355.1 adenylate/guanylate cyclase domain-containing protein [Bacteroidales bacterium]
MQIPFISAKTQDIPRFFTPRIQHVAFPLHPVDVPNTSFFRDKTGTLYIGKETGLNIINGTNHIYLPLDGPVYVAEHHQDTVYYTCENDFGFLSFGPQSGISAVSLSTSFPGYFREFYPFQFISCAGDLFINADAGILRISGTETERLFTGNIRSRLFQSGELLFLFVPDSGIYRYSGDRFRLIVPHALIDREKVVSVTVHDELLQIITSRGTIWEKTPGLNPPVCSDVLNFGAPILLAETLSDTLLLFATNGNGLFITDYDGNVRNELYHKGGLPSGSVVDLVRDPHEGFWVLSGYGLHRVDYPSTLLIAEIPAAFGSILKSAYLPGSFFIGTETGLYRIGLHSSTENTWTIDPLIGPDDESFHLFETVNATLFAGGSEHLYVLSGSTLQCIDTGAFSALHAPADTLLVASGSRGVVRYAKTGGAWKKTILDPSLTYAHSFAECNRTVCFLSSGNRVHLLSQDMRTIETRSYEIEGAFLKLVPLEGRLYLIGPDRVYLMDSTGTAFHESNDHSLLCLAHSEMIYLDETGTCWTVGQTGSQTASLSIFVEGKGSSGHSLLPVISRLGALSGIYADDHHVWITGEHSLMQLDRSGIQDTVTGKKFLRFERIIHNGNEVIRFGRMTGTPGTAGTGKIYSIPHSENALEFQLTQTEYQADIPPLFRYRLLRDQPADRERWSEWNQRPAYRLNNLGHGTYTLQAQSRDLFGNISETVSFDFRIMPPDALRWYAFVCYGILLALLSFFIYKWRLLGLQRVEKRVSEKIRSQLDDLSRQKEQSDRLIAEILPKGTAEQMKASGRARWEKYDMATVLFSDIEGFTKIAEEMNPEELIDELDKFFFHFDSVVDKYNIEKIKTIGDAYMAAGGIPEKNSTNPVEVVLAALEMQYYMNALRKTKTDIWDLRIGIHSGPVIAGVVGHKKVSYDIWGDTVNTASRMESSGLPGKVNVSGITYSLVKDYFICEYRGKLPVKYKGNIDMYFVTGLRPELSIDLKGLPNRRFFLKLQFMRLNDLTERVFTTILSDLPATMQFHTAQYVRKVFDQVFLLCRAEEVEEEDMLIVRTAALLCFTGLTQTYTNFENRSAVIARDLLPVFRYSEKQIDQVTNLILATKQPFEPVNILEKILIDARMEYIGRPDFISNLQLLLFEMRENYQEFSLKEWKKKQLKLLQEFQFYTLAGSRLREIPAEKQIEMLEGKEWL